MAVDHVFAAVGNKGKVFIRATPEDKGARIQQVVWGDWIRVLSRER